MDARHPTRLGSVSSGLTLFFLVAPVFARQDPPPAPPPGDSSVAAPPLLQRSETRKRFEDMEKRRQELRDRIKNLPASPFTRFHLENRGSVPIWYALYYLPYEAPVPGYAPPTPAWKLVAWVNLAPGESRYIGDTADLTFYIYAIDANGHEWKGDDFHATLASSTPPGQRDVGFKKVVRTTHPSSFTTGYAYVPPKGP